MTMVHRFKYLRPGSIGETLTLLSETQDTAILAGGTDLITNMKENIVTPGTIIDIKQLKELRKIAFHDNSLTIGALTTFNQLIDSETINTHFPIIMEVSKAVASTGVRNRATMAGNICSAVPCMDSGPLLLVFDAEITLKSIDHQRTVPIHQWFTGPRITDIKNDELLTAISIKSPADKHGACYVKLGRYKGEDLAQASVLVVCLPDNHYRVAFGSVGPVPIRAKNIESLLNGHQLTDQRIEEAKKLIPGEIKPISDIRASKEYRMHMSQVMFGRAIKAAHQRLNNSGPKYGTRLI